MKTPPRRNPQDRTQLPSTASIIAWGKSLGFTSIGITNTDLSEHEPHLQAWLDKQYHGTMTYMAKHGTKRTRPQELVPNTLSIVSVMLNYQPQTPPTQEELDHPNNAIIARYAWGRDYHKVMRKKLRQFAHKIQDHIGHLGYRAFCDSAPVMERALAQKSGLGFIGKNTNLISTSHGSWYFLGEIFTDMPLEISKPMTTQHCGSCRACIDVCPTQAIVAPYQLDANRCISYLTIEYKGSIPLELRTLIGNRVFGCDDCQTICPWNKFATPTQELDFIPKDAFYQKQLIELFLWDEATFLTQTEGSPIRRVGYECWLRNLAICLGNAPKTQQIICALKKQLQHATPLVAEHIQWALEQNN